MPIGLSGFDQQDSLGSADWRAFVNQEGGLDIGSHAFRGREDLPAKSWRVRVEIPAPFQFMLLPIKPVIPPVSALPLLRPGGRSVGDLGGLFSHVRIVA